MMEAGSSIEANESSINHSLESDASMSSSSNQEEMNKYVGKQIEELQSEMNQYSAKIEENENKLKEVQAELKLYRSKLAICRKKMDNIVKAQLLLNEACTEKLSEENVECLTEQQVSENIDLPTSSAGNGNHSRPVQNGQQNGHREKTLSDCFSDNDTVSSYRPSTQTQSTATQSIEEINMAKKNIPWTIACQKLLHDLRRNKDSYYFRNPVDETDYPDYRKYVTTPISLLEINEQFQAGNYDSPIEFFKDVDLIFINSRKYNEDKRLRVYRQTTRLKKFYKKYKDEILSNWKASKKLNNSSPSKRKSSGKADDSDDDSEIQLRRRSKRRRLSITDDESSVSKKTSVKDDDYSQDNDDDDDDNENERRIETRSRSALKTTRNSRRSKCEDSDEDDTESTSSEDDDSCNESSDDEHSTVYEDFDYSSAIDDEIEDENEVEDKNKNENLVPLTPANVLDGVNNNDILSVTGKVCKVYNARRQMSAAKGQSYKLYKFLLTLGGGKNIQFVAWEESADYSQSIIRCNQVVEVKNVKVKFCRNKNYNDGDFDFQLLILYDPHTIQSSVITVL